MGNMEAKEESMSLNGNKRYMKKPKEVKFKHLVEV